MSAPRRHCWHGRLWAVTGIVVSPELRSRLRAPGRLKARIADLRAQRRDGPTIPRA